MIITIIIILLTIILIYLLTKFMKTKNYKAIIIIFAIIIISCLSYLLYTTNKDYKVIYDGYISDFDSIIISNMDEYNEFMSDSNEWNKEYKQKIFSIKYNESYFKNKSLALIFITTGTSMNKFIGVDISTANNTLIVEPNIKYASDTVTMDITGKLILVEVDKSVTNIEIQR